jgi:hypothetical protein
VYAEGILKSVEEMTRPKSISNTNKPVPKLKGKMIFDFYPEVSHVDGPHISTPFLPSSNWNEPHGTRSPGFSINLSKGRSETIVGDL